MQAQAQAHPLPTKYKKIAIALLIAALILLTISILAAISYMIGGLSWVATAFGNSNLAIASYSTAAGLCGIVSYNFYKMESQHNEIIDAQSIFNAHQQ
jgi:hypothetical protein